MNAFDKGLAVEARGMAVLTPYLRARAKMGQIVVINKGPLQSYLQRSVGDALMNVSEDRLVSIEVKCESDDQHGNFFLETWSNKNIENRYQHGERGSTPGWMLTLRADWLLYYFVEPDDLYIIDFFRLKQWAFGCGDAKPNIERYPERRQGKYDQRNDTWGRCVPIVDVRSALGKSIKLAHPAHALSEVDGEAA